MTYRQEVKVITADTSQIIVKENKENLGNKYFINRVNTVYITFKDNTGVIVEFIRIPMELTKAEVEEYLSNIISGFMEVFKTYE